MPEVTLMTLDVSSSATGYSQLFADNSVSFGLITPRSADPAIVRIDGMVTKLEARVREQRPGLVLLEWSSGKVHGRIGRASGLSVLGAAQGATRQMLISLGIPVETVGEEWTGNRPKKSRAAEIAAMYPAYGAWAAKGGDRGMDVADSLGLLVWWQGQQETKRLMALAGATP